ncbi:MAG: hypothetical protein ACREWI_06790 [Telluria sp.]
MNSRRFFLQHCVMGGGTLAVGGLLSACGVGAEETGAVPPPVKNGTAGKVSAVSGSADAWRMPDEAEAHKATWMAYGASSAVWTRAQLP